MGKIHYQSGNIHHNINARKYACLILEWNQYMQLIRCNKLFFAPYYIGLLNEQAKHVADTENFKSSHHGKNRWEYENGI